MSSFSPRSPATQPEDELRGRRRAVVAAGALLFVVAAFVVYQPCFKGGLILDDDIYITAMGLLPAPDGLQRIWFSNQQPEYYPINYTVLWLEWRAWGMNPAGYRVVNVLLQITVALLLWRLLRKLAIPGAYLASLVFLLHPVNVESVAWIFQIRNLLSMAFSIVSILCYLRAQQGRETGDESRRRGIWYSLLSLLAFVLAMLCKGSVAILPLVLLLINWWRQGRFTIGNFVRAAPYFLVSVALTGVNLWFQTRGWAPPIRSANFAERAADASTIVWFYLSKAFLPIDLLFIYPLWQIRHDVWLWWLPLLAAMAVTAVLLWHRNNRWGRGLLFTWMFYCVALIPVLGFTDIRFMKYSMVADHYQYIALAGVAALAAAGWSIWYRASRGAGRSAAILTMAAAVGALSLLAWQQNRLFGDTIALYRNTVTGNPDCWMIQNFLGNELARAGRSQEAIDCYEQVLRLNPAFPGAHANLGLLLALGGQTQVGIEHLQEALRLDAGLEEAHNDLGLVLVSVGRIPEAVEHYHEAIRLKPDFVEAWTNLAYADAKLGKPDEALFAAQRALELATSHDQAALAQQIDAWLKSYRERLANPPAGTMKPDTLPQQ